MSSDPLHDLRSAWKSENAAIPGDDLNSADQDTQNKVFALQAIWKQQSVEFQVDLPKLQQRYSKRQGSRSNLRSMPLYAFAALACAATLMIWISRARATSESNSSIDSTAVSALDPTDEERDLPEAPIAPVVSVEHDAFDVSDPQIRSVAQDSITYREDGIELVSGSVRLVLVNPRTPQTH